MPPKKTTTAKEERAVLRFRTESGKIGTSSAEAASEHADQEDWYVYREHKTKMHFLYTKKPGAGPVDSYENPVPLTQVWLDKHFPPKKESTGQRGRAKGYGVKTHGGTGLNAKAIDAIFEHLDFYFNKDKDAEKLRTEHKSFGELLRAVMKEHPFTQVETAKGVRNTTSVNKGPRPSFNGLSTVNEEDQQKAYDIWQAWMEKVKPEGDSFLKATEKKFTEVSDLGKHPENYVKMEGFNDTKFVRAKTTSELASMKAEAPKKPRGKGAAKK